MPDKLAEIDTRFKLALKAKDVEKLAILRMLKASLENAKIEKRDTLTEEEQQQVIRKEVKKRKESAKIYKDSGEEERATKEESEAKYLQQFLPAELSEEVLTSKVKDILDKTSEIDFGKAMGLVMKEIKGEASGEKIKKIVEQILSKNKN